MSLPANIQVQAQPAKTEQQELMLDGKKIGDVYFNADAENPYHVALHVFYKSINSIENLELIQAHDKSLSGAINKALERGIHDHSAVIQGIITLSERLQAEDAA